MFVCIPAGSTCSSSAARACPADAGLVRHLHLAVRHDRRGPRSSRPEFVDRPMRHAADRLSLQVSPTCSLADTPTHADYFAEARGVHRDRFGVLWLGAQDDVFQPQPDVRAGAEPRFVPRHVPPVAGPADDHQGGQAAGTRRHRVRIVGSGQDGDVVDALAARARTHERRVGRARAARGHATEIAAARCASASSARPTRRPRVVPNKVFECLAVGRPIVTADTRRDPRRAARAGRRRSRRGPGGARPGDPRAARRPNPSGHARGGRSRAVPARLQRGSARQAPRGLRRSARGAARDYDERWPAVQSQSAEATAARARVMPCRAWPHRRRLAQCESRHSPASSRGTSSSSTRSVIPQSTRPPTGMPSTSKPSGQRAFVNRCSRRCGVPQLRDGRRQDLGHLLAIRHPLDHGRDAAEEGEHVHVRRPAPNGRQLGDNGYERRVETDLLLGFAQCGRDQALVVRVDAAAWERELSAVVTVVGAHDQHDAQLAVPSR